jgi:hypothetical protein
MCKPIGEELCPFTSSRPAISTSVNTTWRTACPIEDSMECAATTLTQYYDDSAALHSALFNYTPLVIGVTDKNKQLTIIKPTQTGINSNK